MRGIVFSCYQYYYKYGSFPSYTIDENNKPLHSWRVLLLPDIGEKELYDKIRLDEPWNSEYNSQFHDYVVPLYQCRSSINRKKGRTNYFLVTGEGSLFDKSGKLIMDSENQRILLVESSKDVNWMCPVDISYTEYKSSKFVPAAKYHFNLANNDLGVQRIISEPFYLYLDSIEIFFLCVLFALCVIVILRVCYIVILLFYIRS
jgi:hypothetical protein